MAKKIGKRYVLSGTVKRVVQDDITVAVWARSPQAALDEAEKFLGRFPDPTDVDAVDYAYIENRDTLEAEVLHLEIVKKG